MSTSAGLKMEPRYSEGYSCQSDIFRPSTLGSAVLRGLMVLLFCAPCWAQQGGLKPAGSHEHSGHHANDKEEAGPSAESGPGCSGVRRSSECCPCMQRGVDSMCPMMGMMKHQMMGSGGMKRGQMATVLAHAAVPGIPGASHLFHIGARGFFLNHAEHLDLSDEQKQQLNRIRERAVLERARHRAEIRSMELDVWQVTGLDKPNMSDIEAKIRSVEKARSDTRLNYLREIERAVNVLTEQQRTLLLMGDGKRQAVIETPRAVDEGSPEETEEDNED